MVCPKPKILATPLVCVRLAAMLRKIGNGIWRNFTQSFGARTVGLWMSSLERTAVFYVYERARVSRKCRTCFEFQVLLDFLLVLFRFIESPHVYDTATSTRRQLPICLPCSWRRTVQSYLVESFPRAATSTTRPFQPPLYTVSHKTCPKLLSISLPNNDRF